MSATPPPTRKFVNTNGRTPRIFFRIALHHLE
jgi:hypothetical protein